MSVRRRYLLSQVRRDLARKMVFVAGPRQVGSCTGCCCRQICCRPCGPKHGRYLTEHIPSAKFVELSGVDHLFFAEDVDHLLAEIQEFLDILTEVSEV